MKTTITGYCSPLLKTIQSFRRVSSNNKKESPKKPGQNGRENTGPDTKDVGKFLRPKPKSESLVQSTTPESLVSGSELSSY